jgi:hypothetical protein
MTVVKGPSERVVGNEQMERQQHRRLDSFMNGATVAARAWDVGAFPNAEPNALTERPLLD